MRYGHGSPSFGGRHRLVISIDVAQARRAIWSRIGMLSGWGAYSDVRRAAPASIEFRHVAGSPEADIRSASRAYLMPGRLCRVRADLRVDELSV